MGSDRSGPVDIDALVDDVKTAANEAQTAREPSHVRPRAPEPADADLAAQKAADEAIRQEAIRLTAKAHLINAWLYRARSHRGLEFICGPADVQALEQMEHWQLQIPSEEPAR
jgi:hypothetical protein